MNKKQIKRTYNVVIIAALVVFIGLVCSRFVHWGNVEYTDDAQVWRHITPINARVGGFIKEVRFDDYQHVKKGDTLVIIEDAEFRLALAQAEAHLRGSKSGSSAVTAGMSTTASNVRAASAGIDEARVQMENAGSGLSNCCRRMLSPASNTTMSRPCTKQQRLAMRLPAIANRPPLRCLVNSSNV